MRLSTSVRISLLFSGLTTLLVVFFGVAILRFFATNWQQAERKLLTLPPQAVERMDERGMKGLAQRFMHTVVLDQDDISARYFIDQDAPQGLVAFNDKRLMYKTYREKVVLRDVTMHMERQQDLQRMLIWAVLLAAIASFFIGQMFVRRALRDLRYVTKKIEELHIDALQFEHSLDHLPEHDEIRTIAQALSTMAGNLQQQVADIKQFVANASHELRTPLMVLRSSHELALKTKKYKAAINKNITTIDQMEGLISTLLMIARSETNGFVTKSTMIAPLVQRIGDIVREQYSDKDITLTIQGDAAVTVQAHASSVERLLHNLLSNAYKYTLPGGQILISFDAQGLQVQDTGVGIAPAHLATIRQPFWQVDASKGEDTGFGLGLALVKRLVEMHGWEISVESELGKGTTFRIVW